MSFEDFELVYSYTRKEALADGVLVDVTEQAKESGFKIHTAITDHLYHRYIVPPAGLEGQGQSINGRLNDLFTMCKATACSRCEKSTIYFDVLFLMGDMHLEKVRCYAIVGPSDDLSPCLTFMLIADM